MKHAAVNEQDDVLLTPLQLAERWQMYDEDGKEIQTRTLANWRMFNRGPKFIKLGKGKGAPVRYRLSDVIQYENHQTKKTKEQK